MVPETLSYQLLESVGARIIVLQAHGTKQILAAGTLPSAVDEVYDLRQSDLLESLPATIRSLISPQGRVITLLGEAPMGGEAIELTMDEAPLKQALAAYSRRLLNFTLALCAIVASLAVISIHLLVLRPVQKLTTSLVDFGSNPEDASRIIVPSGKPDEIGQAEEALAAMQKTLVRELNQKKHLAALGLAVAKINHDLRNMLTSAQLLSDRLANVTDPLAQRLAPKLVATLDRAVRFCQATLTYGRAVDEPPKLQPVFLRGIVDEVTEAVLLATQGTVDIINKVPEEFEIFADAEHMFRILMNLIRNGVEALENAGPATGQPARVIIGARYERGASIIEIADTGPGVPDSIRDKLFSAFFNTTRTGGSGLGLVIAADLVRAQGGMIVLLPANETSGATFKITLPPKNINSRG
jgi:signal transduction histidine kinase